LNVIIIWNLTDGTQIKRESQQATVSSLVSLSDSTLAIGFQNDLDIRIWDLNTDIKRILSNEGYVYSLGTYSKNQILIAGSSSFIKIWNWESSTLNQTIKSGYGNPLSLFMDNLELVSGFDDKTIRVWNLIESKIKNNNGFYFVVNNLNETYFTTDPDSKFDFPFLINGTKTIN
jgi:WD40 repeat protein